MSAASLVASLIALALLPAGCGHAPPPSASDTYQLKRVFEVLGRQGIAVDERRYYVSGSAALYAYSKDGSLEAVNEDPFRQLQKRANHIGDIGVYRGEIHEVYVYSLPGS